MKSLVDRFFSKNQSSTVCLIGEVNTGKSTLANRISTDFAAQKMSETSEVPHETRTINKMEHIDFKIGKNKLDLTLVDTPGIATSVDYKEFIQHGMTEQEAYNRAKEATSGIIASINFLKQVDVALVLMDATKPPFDQVSLTILGTLEMHKTKTIICANKTDLEGANTDIIKSSFPHVSVVPISALKGHGMNELYNEIISIA
ncbi:MAG: 50S ribosome-binding GTPase [Candidatus Heimdallarchaeota archaeon]|nr:50S ribosome-binding GTPase [Candidatus Heimdallarchaeota archaeon]MDH5646951.1 50S ribosome-binding GTPase [Candidatus Heimdallarchaeota archaeon]